MQDNASTPVTPAVQPSDAQNKSVVELYIRQIIAAAVWSYSLVHVFLFDVDAYVVSVLPQNLSWVFGYKLVLFLCSASIFWMVGGTKRFFMWAAYIFTYPAIVLFNFAHMLWKAQSWVLVIAALNVGLSFFKSFKFNFIATSVALASVCLCMWSNYRILVICSIAILLSLLFVLIARRAISIFRPSGLYEVHSKVVKVALGIGQKISLPSPEVRVIAVANMPAEVRVKWLEGLQNAVLFNRGAYFFSVKLDAYKKSRASTFFYIADFILILLMTLLMLSVINFAIFRIHPSGFVVAGNVRWFDFLYYAFNSMVGNGADALKPVGDGERLVNMLGVFFSISLTGILLTLLFSVRLERDEEEISEAVRDIKKQADAYEDVIQENFNLTVLQALEELQRAKSALISVIYFFHNQSL
jgi:hypothetical protein